MSPASKPRLVGIKEWITIFVCGICMGAADIVPGISGGTMAFIMGIYEDLLKSINSINLTTLGQLFRLRFRAFFSSVAWEFLLALLSGIVFSFITLAHFFDFVLNHETYRTFLYAGFLGLILASVVFCAKQLHEWRLKYIAALGIGAVIAFLLTDTDLKPVQNEPLFNVSLHQDQIPQHAAPIIQNYLYDQELLIDVPESYVAAMIAKQLISKETPVFNQTTQTKGVAGDFVEGAFRHSLDLWLIFCGAIAISAMLLPGISGSYLLTILGSYSLAIGALADFMQALKKGSFETEAFMILLSLLIGIVVGALVFSRVVSWLLDHYHQISIAVLTGFMIGALQSVWPFWTYEYFLLPFKLEKGPLLNAVNPILPDFSSSLFWISCLFAISGFILVLAIEYIASYKKTHD